MANSVTPQRPWYTRLLHAIGIGESPEKKALDAEIERGQTKRMDATNRRQMQQVDDYRERTA